MTRRSSRRTIAAAVRVGRAAGRARRRGRGAASVDAASAASGRARTTRSADAGSRCSRCDHRPQSPGHAVAHHGVADRPCRPRNRPVHRAADTPSRPPREVARAVRGRWSTMVGRPARRPDRTTAVNSGRRRMRACAGNTSGGELLATLAPTTSEDRPARAGPHAQPEPVGLRPTAVVRLERCACSRGTPTTRHRRCASAGGRVRAEVGAAVRRYPVAPEAGHCERRAPTDFDQHNRGNTTADGRAHPDHPWCTRGPPAGERRAEPTRPAEVGDRCRAVDGAVSVAVAPRWTSGS